MGVVVNAVVNFFTNIINGVVTGWMNMNESRKRGRAEKLNEVYEEGSKRKARFDRVMAQPIKKGKALIASLRGISSNTGGST
jgi:uncharacterized membrane protein (DUF106 family)